MDRAGETEEARDRERKRETSCQGFLNGTAISTCKNKSFESLLLQLRQSEKILSVTVSDMLLLPFTRCTLSTLMDVHQLPFMYSAGAHVHAHALRKPHFRVSEVEEEPEHFSVIQ